MAGREKRAKLMAREEAVVDDDEGDDALPLNQEQQPPARKEATAPPTKKKKGGVRFQLDPEVEARQHQREQAAAQQHRQQQAKEEGEEEEEALGPWLSWADKATTISLLSSSSEAEKPDAIYNPEFTHQVIGESEKIFGYEGLHVEVMYSAGALSSYAGIEYEDRVDSEDKDAEPDDVVKAVLEWMPPDCTTDRSAFLKQVDADKESFAPVGTLVHEGKGKHGDDLAVYLATAETKGFKEYHARAQTLPIWSIEQATWLDLDDSNWRLFYLFKRVPGEGGQRFELLGFTSVYEYFVMPNKIRPRISQHLVLPPFQRRGYGSFLLKAVMAHLRSLDRVVDITVEAPNGAFSLIRDKIDCAECLKLPFVQQFSFDTTGPAPFVEHIREKLKLCKSQARHVYEMLHFLAVVNGQASEETFLRRVKTRLYQPHYHELRVKDRLKPKLSHRERALLDQQKKEIQQSIQDGAKAVCRAYAAMLKPTDT